MQFTLSFAPWLQQFGFTRPELLANPFVSHPAWQVTARDAAGAVVAQVGEDEIDSFTNVGAQRFLLGQPGTPGIATVQFASDSSGLTTFNGMLLDDLIVVTNPAAFPPAVTMTRPISGRVLTAPPALTVAADAADAAGIAAVRFYANRSLLGVVAAPPYARQWTDPPVGDYVLTAVASNVLGLTWTSAPVTVSIRPVGTQFGILSQPASQTIAAGGSATFTVVTTGSNGVTYQWSHNGAPIPGAFSDTYVIKPPIQDSNAGTYTVAATSREVTLVSEPAVLTVVDAPVFTLQPAGQTVGIGSDVSLHVWRRTARRLHGSGC